MATKHRTQISLEDWQYEFLKEKAKKEKTSISSVIRNLVTEKTKLRHIKKDPIFSLVGIAKGNGTSIARTHDKHLYKKDWRKH